MVKGLVIGFLLGLAAVAGGVYYYFATGMAPVATADPSMPFERELAGMALDAHIDKQSVGPSPVSADKGTFLAGAQIYRDNCAACHGLPGQPPTEYASSMFPKPTQLFLGKGVTDDPVSESYWKAANGIRLSGMPAFNKTLTEEQLWQVSELVAHADEIPDSAKQVLLANSPAAASSSTAADGPSQGTASGDRR